MVVEMLYVVLFDAHTPEQAVVWAGWFTSSAAS
jgi:hypothetical protein